MAITSAAMATAKDGLRYLRILGQDARAWDYSVACGGGAPSRAASCAISWRIGSGPATSGVATRRRPMQRGQCSGAM
jgi:hypothetical protein